MGAQLLFGALPLFFRSVVSRGFGIVGEAIPSAGVRAAMAAHELVGAGEHWVNPGTVEAPDCGAGSTVLDKVAPRPRSLF